MERAMKSWRVEWVAVLVACAALVASVAACSAETPVSEPAQVPAPEASAGIPENVPETDEDMMYADVPPPKPDSILYLIYQRDGDGATSYEIANGAWVTYWYGHRFELGGKRYFTGFAHATRERFPGDGEDSGPEERVHLAHATLELTDPGAEKPWTFIGAEPFIGSFGGNDRGNEVDTTRSPEEFRTGDGRLVLAVPTWSLQSGERIDGFDVLAYNPAEELPVEQKHWTYLGNVATGGENSAACGDSGPAPCVSSEGTLEFVASADGGLPLIRVVRSGTVVSGPGETRALGASDTIDYTFSEADGEYRAARD